MNQWVMNKSNTDQIVRAAELRSTHPRVLDLSECQSLIESCPVIVKLGALPRFLRLDKALTVFSHSPRTHH
jgi:hypothetical protein